MLGLVIVSMFCCATYDISTISVPGFYKLSANISNQISIATSNVTLDLNGYTITGGQSGIVVASNLSNIVIKNGSIYTVPADGVRVNSGCTNIILKNMEIADSVRAISFENVMNSSITQCDMNISTTALELSNCRNIVVQDCVANSNKNAGYSLVSSSTCSVISCSALSTGRNNGTIAGDRSNVFGFVSSGGIANNFFQCIANSTQNLTATGQNSIIAGFGLKQQESYSTIANCVASNSSTNTLAFSVPYGIWVESTLTVSQQNTANTSDIALSLGWSPDGQYLTTGCGSAGSVEIILYKVDRISNTLQVRQNIAYTASVYRVPWSQSGAYIGTAGSPAGFAHIYEFDAINEKLVDIISFESGAGVVLDWHPSQQYLVVDQQVTNIKVYKFNPTAQVATQAAAFAYTPQLAVGKWQPKKTNSYIFATGNNTNGSPSVRVFGFNPSAGTITQIASNDSLTGTQRAITLDWSPDCRYITAGGNGGAIIVMEFDGISSLTTVASFTVGSTVTNLLWSPDGRYIAGISTNGELAIYFFDRGLNTISKVFGVSVGTVGSISAVSWSPDGAYIAVATGSGTTNAVRLFAAYSFASHNTISLNTAYNNVGSRLNSGVGISGSTIANAMIQNNSYNNLFNYQFSTNTFEQPFGQAPSLLQNIALTYNNPILTPDDIPLRIKRTESLLEKLINTLL